MRSPYWIAAFTMFTMKMTRYIVAIFASALASVAFASGIDIDCSKTLNKVTEYLHGTCLEDLNCEIYGGLYGQLIYGEKFQEPVATNTLQKDFGTRLGMWHQTPDGVVCEPHSLGAVLAYKPVKFKEAIVSVEAMLDEISWKTGIFVNGIENSEHNSKETYRVYFRNMGQAVSVSKYASDGVFRDIKTFPLKNNPDNFQKLRVRISEAKGIEIYANGEFVGNVQEAKPTRTGTCGIFATGGSPVFRNFEVLTAEKLYTSSLQGKNISEGLSNQWKTWGQQDGDVKFEIKDESGRQAQVLDINKGRAAIYNCGGWGINARQGEPFSGKLRLKIEDFTDMSISVKIVSSNDKVLGQTQVKFDATKISDYQTADFTLTPAESDTASRFVIEAQGTGKLHLNYVSLFDQKGWNGLPVRADIAEKMKKSGIKFIRMGGTMVNNPNFKFKNMVGDPALRPNFTGFWYKYASLGFADIEFVAFARKMGAEPIFAVNIQETTQDISDMIDYFNGDNTTQWGRKRIADGYKEPFNIQYIQIGNEENIAYSSEKNYRKFLDNFKRIATAIKQKDKNIKIVTALWWRNGSKMDEMAFREMDGLCDYWDYHPWTDKVENITGFVEKTITGMQAAFKKWNPNTNMKCAILEENGESHNLGRGLGHALMINIVRRNGEFVLASCPANALQADGRNFNGWDQGQIFFNSNKVWGQPVFHTQAMASANYTDNNIKVSNPHKDLDVTAGIAPDGDLVVYAVNATDKPVKTKLNISNFAGNTAKAHVHELSGNPIDSNSAETPDKVAPVEKEAALQDSEYEFAPYSYTILRFSKSKK